MVDTGHYMTLVSLSPTIDAKQEVTDMLSPQGRNVFFPY
jgi:hypothetical protein